MEDGEDGGDGKDGEDKLIGEIARTERQRQRQRRGVDLKGEGRVVKQ